MAKIRSLQKRNWIEKTAKTRREKSPLYVIKYWSGQNSHKWTCANASALSSSSSSHFFLGVAHCTNTPKNAWKLFPRAEVTKKKIFVSNKYWNFKLNESLSYFVSAVTHMGLPYHLRKSFTLIIYLIIA